MAENKANKTAKPAKGGKTELDLDAGRPKVSKKQKVLYLIIGLLALGLGAAVTMLLTRPEGGGGQENGFDVKPATYLPFRTMVVNFSQKGPARFLQVDMQAMVFSPAVSAAIETHMPAIRNDILLLLGSQTYESVSTREGKEQLREQIKQAIQRILEQHGVAGTVEAIYFTSFVMQ